MLELKVMKTYLKSQEFKGNIAQVLRNSPKVLRNAREVRIPKNPKNSTSKNQFLGKEGRGKH